MLNTCNEVKRSELAHDCLCGCRLLIFGGCLRRRHRSIKSGSAAGWLEEPMGWDGSLVARRRCGCAPVVRRLVRPMTSCRRATSQPSDSERGSCCPPRRRWQRHCRTGEARRWHGRDVRRGAPAAGWRPPTILTELVGSGHLCWSIFFTAPRSTACSASCIHHRQAVMPAGWI
ncbi:hypothetical protein PVAP13_9KG235126 [Panicum virgatum]|uniref:Uncharacterized protein n=1 Tax=Panicum virgatum TaxID=38727 RepID=A0A8T0NQI0_PANVG|nr:hypothetical protein PVAP13_9KG235126 [Panicum virgatum]